MREAVLWHGIMPVSARLGTCTRLTAVAGCRRLRVRPRAAAAAAAPLLVASLPLHQPDITPSAKPQPLQQPTPPDDAELAALARLVAAAGVPADEPQIVATELAAVHALLTSLDALPVPLVERADFAAAALQFSSLIGTGSTWRTLQMVKRHPALLELGAPDVASRVLALALCLPGANVPELLYQRPSLLLLPDIPAVVGPALAQMTALMPGIPLTRKLHEGSAFWSFASLLDARATAAAAAAAGHSSHSSDGGG
jgi:hypothetical protein